MTKILVLEDEASIRSFISINLRRQGFIVVEALADWKSARSYDSCVPKWAL